MEAERYEAGLRKPGRQRGRKVGREGVQEVWKVGMKPSRLEREAGRLRDRQETEKEEDRKAD